SGQRSIGSLDELTRWLGEHQPSCLRLNGVPDPRTSGEVTALALLANDDVSAAVAALDVRDGIEPEALSAAAERLGYRTAAVPGRSLGTYDAVFEPEGAQTAGAAARAAALALWSDGEALDASHSLRELANDPSASRRTGDLVSSVRAHLQSALPD